MEYSYKFRLYPNREQEKQILRTLGCCRFVFNHYLAKRKEVYAQDGKTLNYYDCAGDMTQPCNPRYGIWIQPFRTSSAV